MIRLLPLLLVACGEQAPTDTAAEDPAEHACEEVGAGTLLTAKEVLEQAPTVEIGQPYLVEVASTGPVYVAIDSQEDAILWVGTADVVSGLHLDGAPSFLPEPTPNEACPADIPEHFDLHLEPGAWHLQLGPSAVSQVWLLLTEAGDHAHER